MMVRTMGEGLVVREVAPMRICEELRRPQEVLALYGAVFWGGRRWRSWHGRRRLRKAQQAMLFGGVEE